MSISAGALGSSVVGCWSSVKRDGAGPCGGIASPLRSLASPLRSLASLSVSPRLIVPYCVLSSLCYLGAPRCLSSGRGGAVVSPVLKCGVASMSCGSLDRRGANRSRSLGQAGLARFYADVRAGRPSRDGLAVPSWSLRSSELSPIAE